MKITLNKNSWHYQFYVRTYLAGYHQSHDNSINNLCPYFHKVFWAIVFLPFTCFTYIFPNDFRTSLCKRLWNSWFIYVLLLLDYTFGMLVVYSAIEENNISGWWLSFAVFVFPVMMGIVLLIAYGIEKCIIQPYIKVCEHLKKQRQLTEKIKQKQRNEKKSQESNIFVEKYKAVKNKVCPTIEWKDNDG